MEKEALQKRISEKLGELFTKDSDGQFYDEIYKDYSDELSDQTVREILSSEDPESHFYESLTDIYQEEVWRLEDEAIDRLCEDPELKAAWEENEDLFRDLLFDQFYVKIPYAEYMAEDQEILLVLDTGDGNYDFVLNSFNHRYYGDREEEVDDHSSLLWLCRQQGVSKEELEAALRTGICYPREMEALMERHSDVKKALRGLGYIPDKPLDTYHQRGEFKTLLRAELAVQNLEQKVRKCEANLASCELSYEAYCEKWYSMSGYNKNQQPPPSEVYWERKKRYVQERNTELLTTLRPELEKAKAELESCLKQPAIALTADLRTRLRELDEEYLPMRQTPEFAKGRFLESILNESANTTSHMNALAAPVTMTLQEAIDLNKAIEAESSLNNSYEPEERKGEGSILLDQNAVLGLYDAWNGAGSLFEIKLMTPLEIPIRFIHDANIDGNLGYGLNQIYGGMEFKQCLREIRPMTAQPEKQPLDKALQAARDATYDPHPSEMQTRHSER